MTDQPTIEVPQFYFSKAADIYDGAPWTEMDVDDLRAAVAAGSTVEEAAGHLCRSGTVDDVKRKAEELGLQWRAS